jgi:Protein of unknown function (DUF3168)
MSQVIFALRKAIRAPLAADSDFTGIVGGALVYDLAPRRAEPPYVTFEDVEARDWSTGTDKGYEQLLGLSVWAREGGQSQALAAAERVADVLDDATLALDGHRLIQMRVTAVELRRTRDAQFLRATVRLRATSEVAA